MNKEIKYYLTKVNSQWILVSDEYINLTELAVNIYEPRFDVCNESNKDSIQEWWKKVISQQPILTSLREEEQKIIGFVDVEKLWDSQPKLYEVEVELEDLYDDDNNMEVITQPKITKEGVKILKLK